MEWCFDSPKEAVSFAVSKTAEGTVVYLRDGPGRSVVDEDESDPPSGIPSHFFCTSGCGNTVTDEQPEGQPFVAAVPGDSAETVYARFKNLAREVD